MRILVAGGAGFIGSHFVRTLLTNGYENLACDQVTVVDLLTYAGRRENLDPVLTDSRLTFVRGDIADLQLLDSVMPGHDLVINFAAESHVDRSINSPMPFLHSNVSGAVAIMESCLRHQVRRMVQVSTDEVYGSIAEGSSVEDALLAPNSPYSSSKASADLFARAFFKTYGLDIVVTRCTNNYGPYQFPEKLIPLFITNLIQGKKVPLYGDGLNVREWVHVADHCRGIALAASDGRAGDTFNIGGGTSLTNLDIARLILDAFDCALDDSIEYVTDRPGHDRRYSINDSKIRELGYLPRIDFVEGIHETISWYRDNVEWWNPLVSRRA